MQLLQVGNKSELTLPKIVLKRAKNQLNQPRPPGATIQLRRLSKRPRIFTAEARSALYSKALRSAAQRMGLGLWASSLASWRQFSRRAQFICPGEKQKYSDCYIFPLAGAREFIFIAPSGFFSSHSLVRDEKGLSL